MTDILPSIYQFSSDNAKLGEYKSIIEALKAKKQHEVFRKPSRASGWREQDARQSLKAADESFACCEWVDAGQVYLTLSEAKVGPISSLARLALCQLFCKNIPAAFECAVQGIKESPLESASYLTIAHINLLLKNFSVVGPWLDLAELSLRSHPKLITKAREELKIGALLRTQRIKIVKAFFFSFPTLNPLCTPILTGVHSMTLIHSNSPPLNPPLRC